MSLNKNDVIKHLRGLQRKLILKETLSQSFYTRFNEKSSIVMDFYNILSIDNNKKKLFNGEKVIIKLSANNELLTKEVNKLKAILKTNEKKTKETGVDNLFLGYPYITGNCDKTSKEVSNIFRSPLFLWKINVKQVDNITFEISLQTDCDIIKPTINYVLFSRLAVINKKNIDIFDIDIPQYPSDDFDTFVKVLCKKIGINFDNAEEDQIETIFKKTTISQFLNEKIGKEDLLKSFDDSYCEKFDDFCCLGIFSCENASLIEMYNEMIKDENAIEFYKKLDEKFSIELNNDDKDFLESEIKQITDLDFSQKLAIKKSLNDDTVIQGPPGTGKSQVIANIIANAIYKGKRVLFISEKFTAAEVIEKRLNILSKFSIMLFNLQGTADKDLFYSKVKTILNDINLKPRADEIRESIDKNFEILNSYNEFKCNKNTVQQIKFLQKSKDRFETFKKWNEAVKNLPKFIEENQFWEYINDFIEQKTYYDFYATLFNTNKINLQEIEKITKLANHFNETKFNPSHMDELIFYYRKDKTKKNYSFFNKHANKKFIKANPNVHDFILHKIAINLSKIKTFDFKKFELFYNAIDNLITLELNKFIATYNITNFNYNDILDYQKYLKFEHKNQQVFNFKPEEIKKEIKTLLSKKVIADIETIYARCNANLKKALENEEGLMKEFSDLINHANNKLKRNLDWVIKRYPNALFHAFPIVITNPNTAATLYKNSKFDYVIFDEASQVTIERSIPLIFLSKTAVISGDKQQLQPSSMWQGKLKEEYEDLYDENDQSYISTGLSELQDSNSLLEYIEKKFKNIMLNYHYRSTKRELIEFSNICFYDGNLVVANSPTEKKVGIEVIEVEKGLWEDGINNAEAAKVFEKLEEIVADPKHGSIGIVTFNIKQKMLIEKMIMKSDNILLKKELERVKENGDDDSLFVKNLENVQGDERDIIIISTTYAKNKKGVFNSFFGPVSTAGGENRINVIISRSREKMYIFKSFHSSMLLNSKKEVLPKGVAIFSDFIKYVEILQQNKLDSDAIKTLFHKYLENKNPNILDKIQEKIDTVFESEVISLLKSQINEVEYEVIPQLEQSGYNINLAIKNRKTNEYVLAIEYDDYHYKNLDLSAKENDYYRQHYLESRGWKFYRIDSLEWYRLDRKNAIIKEILGLIG